MSSAGTWPSTGPIRSTATDRICSACAFESVGEVSKTTLVTLVRDTEQGR